MGTASLVLDNFANLSTASLIGTALALWIVYLISLAVQRLYLSPLAKFPGPKLAALSKYYEMYYEVVKRGQFTFHIDELHKRYGPIIRITPEEVHVKDSAYWDVLYNRPKAAKYAWTNGRFGNDTSVFTTSDHAIHRIRRGALNPFFSKKTVGDFEWYVREQVDYFCARIIEYKTDGRILPINKIWNAFAGDVITQYSFGFSYKHLQSVGFKETFHDAFMAVSEFGHIALQFPWITPLINALPDSWNEAMNPPLKKLLQLQRDLRRIISHLTQNTPSPDKDSSQRQQTIFHSILHSDLPPNEKSIRRLADEAQTVIGAGLTTTAWALSVTTFYIASSPAIQLRLREELHAAFLDPNVMPLSRVEKLAYLRGCVREGIRLSVGVSARNPRVVRSPTRYESWDIPGGVPVSMTVADVHMDEAIYPEPEEFRPERWMGSARAPDGQPLDHYFVAFGKGARGCLGINLAYMEMYLAIGCLFRRFSLGIYETDVSDVKIAHDFFLPSPKLDTKGIRVKIASVDPLYEQSLARQE